MAACAHFIEKYVSLITNTYCTMWPKLDGFKYEPLFIMIEKIVLRITDLVFGEEFDGSFVLAL